MTDDNPQMIALIHLSSSAITGAENVTEPNEETPVPPVISDSGDRAPTEYHEMDSYAERDHPERA